MEEAPLVEPENYSSNSVLEAVEQSDEDCDEISEEQCDEFEEENMKDRVTLFLAKLRQNSSMTLSAVNFVVEHTSSLFSDIVDSLQTQPFRGFESEYKQMQYFTQSGYFVHPEEVLFPGVSYTQKRDTLVGIVKQVAVRDTFQRIPLRPLLKLVLESPGTMEKIFEWQNQENTALEDFRDGTIFKKTSELFSKELSIPLVLYNDECEMVNPLGSKTSVHKLGFVYFTLKCLRPEYLSSLNSHFLLAVYKTDDIKTYGINAVLDPIVSEIKNLELEGV
ncbi:uncharacterized protein LOC115384425 [Tachysurus ichikawai]